ncbi:MAG: M23 family metallopeptidase [Candidatus Velthaea sp.]
MTRGFSARISLALVTLSPAVFLGQLATSPAGDAWVLIGEVAFYAAYLAFVAVFVPLGLVLGSRGRIGWLIVAATLPVAIGADRFAAIVTIGRRGADPFGVVEALVSAAWLTFTITVAMKARHAPPGPTLDLTPPVFDGSFTVVQGGNDRLLNHHHQSERQRFAVDLVRDPASRTRISRVVSPLAGTVVAAVDGLDDAGVAAADRRAHPFGNHVIIREPQSGADVMLAHLKRGTVTVSPGEPVAAGRLLGEIGNSGNSTEPHLHVHVECAGAGLPFTIGGRFLVRNAALRGTRATQRRIETTAYASVRDAGSRDSEGVAQ